jgi:uncharacterized protein (UPF0276 family)
MRRLVKEMEELISFNAVLQEADCDLLLDVNNIYVNSINHRYDAETFLQQLAASRIRYVHVAGHYQEAEDLIVDTHGADVADPVWQLLEKPISILALFRPCWSAILISTHWRSCCKK